MIYLELLLGFLKVGCFSFGGAYGAIPLIREVVLSYGWLSEEMLTHIIAVSESTPGPIMVNLATYVGSSQAGFWGAVIATLAVVLPAFLIILLLTALFKALSKNPYLQAVLQGLKPCVIGIVVATGLHLILGNCFAENTVGLREVAITALLAAVMLLYKRFTKKKLPPIPLILLAAGAGILVFGI